MMNRDDFDELRDILLYQCELLEMNVFLLSQSVSDESFSEFLRFCESHYGDMPEWTVND